MKSTKGTIKHNLILLVQRDPQSSWGELQPFEYIEGDRFKTRNAAERRAKNAWMRWQGNYQQYRDAKFRIVDTAELEYNAFFNPMTKAGKPNKPLAALRRIVSGSDKPAIVALGETS